VRPRPLRGVPGRERAPWTMRARCGHVDVQSQLKPIAPNGFIVVEESAIALAGWALARPGQQFDLLIEAFSTAVENASGTLIELPLRNRLARAASYHEVNDW